MTATAVALAAPSAAAWQEASSKHFVVYSDDKPETVRDYTVKLERFDSAIRALRGFKDLPVSNSARVTVYLLKNLDELHRIMPKGSSSNIAGQYLPRSAGPVAVLSNESIGQLTSLDVLLHEYTHHITRSTMSGVFPTWFSEGYAEYHATARFAPDGGVIFGAEPKFREYGIKEYNVVPSEQLMKGRPSIRDGNAQQVFYGRSWLLFHYLQNDPERQQQFRQYITAVSSGTPYQEAGRVFGNPASLDMKMNAYGKRTQLTSAFVPADRIKVGEVTVRTLDPGEAAIMPALIRSRYGIDPKTTGLTVADMARKTGAQFPDNAAVQNELAEAEYDVKNYTAAMAAADRAIAADPKSVHAWLYKGMALSEQLKAAKSTDRTQWQQVRTAFLEANKIEPEYAEPLFQFYLSFADAGQAPSKNAQDGLIYAQALAPAAPDLRMVATKVLLEQNRPADAKKMIEPLVYSLESRREAEWATKALDAMDVGDAPKALGILNDAEKADRDKAEKADKA